jgi:hypothetical protein
VYKHILLNAKLKTRKRGQGTELTERCPLRRSGFIMDWVVVVVEEENEEEGEEAEKKEERRRRGGEEEREEEEENVITQTNVSCKQLKYLNKLLSFK